VIRRFGGTSEGLAKGLKRIAQDGLAISIRAVEHISRLRGAKGGKGVTKSQGDGRGGEGGKGAVAQEKPDVKTRTPKNWGGERG